MTLLNTTTGRALSLVAVLLVSTMVNHAQAKSDPVKVVYHLDDARSGRFALDIAKHQLEAHPDIRIAMVAYGKGVDFLLKGATDEKGRAYAPAVQELLAKGVQFKVCSTTLRLRGIPKDQVLGGMQFVPGGTYEVIRLQAQDGYVYLKP